eukprot:CAMPEP_0201489280 /NCGR_PEP_ID=MMETSP0151_2-20130828/21759_1 /ASSEMBLY_ACC=CAM_ASM_000257 /TAXON_ID=200890 /ORGANISM="Paramoeba atlantica, Strain 621/1 / CCAP 1560/9" /LENGTH=442 /DNA_ID=CAMNT_0047874817 /DNA_START=91 /DNA_END=1419 /DNA_ORIENTATION=+
MTSFVFFLSCLFLGFLGVQGQTNDNFTKPFGVAVAFSGKKAGTAASFSWSTLNATTDYYVFWGQVSGGPYTKVIANSSRYDKSTQYHSIVSGLTPDTRYYYMVGGSEGTSIEYSFVTAKEAGNTDSFRIAVLGDMGIKMSKMTLVRLKQLQDVDWFFHVGDISYADDENLEHPGTYELTWNKWQVAMESVTASFPYMTCPGNHEASCITTGSIGCPDYLNNFTAYRNRFLMPGDDSGGVGNMWYSFDYGMVHFVVMDSETDYDNSPEGPHTLWHAGPFGDQIGWLTNDLNNAVANRDVTPWIIAIAHRPMYSSENEDFPPLALRNWRNAVEDLLYDANVDLYISGHVHAYERIYPMYQSKLEQTNYTNPRDITPLVVGNAGCEEGQTAWSSKTPPDFIAYRNNEDWGYGILELQDPNTLSFEMRRSSDNTVADSFTLIRDNR